MRSESINFPINRNVTLTGEGFNPEKVYRISVLPNGAFTVYYWTGEGENRASDFTEYHLDTDGGFKLFVDLVNRSGRADLAGEIRSSLGVN